MTVPARVMEGVVASLPTKIGEMRVTITCDSVSFGTPPKDDSLTSLRTLEDLSA